MIIAVISHREQSNDTLADVTANQNSSTGQTERQLFGSNF